MSTVFEQYQEKVRRGDLRPDVLQRRAAERLNLLAEELQDYEPQEGLGGWLNRLLPWQREHPPQGIYIWGDVGRGKSMLMDLFFASAVVVRKRRVHFHAFMAEVHRKLHQARQETARDPMPALIDGIAAECWLLCFDEFHVTNIVDAMILGRLFSGLWQAGVVTVATSNWPPNRLYENGLQREQFLPFISQLQQRLEILELNGTQDYRQTRAGQGDGCWFTPHNSTTTEELEDWFIAEADGDTGSSFTLPLPHGRTLNINRASSAVAWLRFEELCAVPLAASDYAALADHYPSLCLEQIPIFSSENLNEMKRFMLLVDVLYEEGTRLAATAATLPEHLCTGGNLAFEFQRTASRLRQMCVVGV